MERPTYHDVVAGPSGKYGFGRPDYVASWETEPAVQVVELFPDGWHGTPARYSMSQAVGFTGRLAIDWGGGWFLSEEDTAALAAYARERI